MKRGWIVLGLGLLLCSFAHAEELVLTASVIGVDHEYANVRTSVSAMEWNQLGVAIGTRMVIEHKGARVDATFVETYGDLAAGKWLGLLEDDHLKIAISFGHACEIMGCAIGDRLTILVMRNRDSLRTE